MSAYPPSGLKIAVSDTGIGIEADKLDVILDKFHQADGSTTRNMAAQGSGLRFPKS